MTIQQETRHGSTAPSTAPSAGLDAGPSAGPSAGDGVGGDRRGQAWRGLLLAGLSLAVVVAASLAFGARAVPLDDLVAALSGGQGNDAQAAVAARIPRTILGLLVGAALALAGAVLQSVTRNPLADPGLLGVTSGAALAVVIGIAFAGLASPVGYIWTAMLGAAVAAAWVLTLHALTPSRSPVGLALAGAATTAALTSVISAILLPRIDVMTLFRFWQIGGVAGADLAQVLLVIPFLLVGALLCWSCARGLDALALGDEVAVSLGERPVALRLRACTGAVILCGAATAVAGPIAFVGLVVPHLARGWSGGQHRRWLPTCMIGGALLLVGADVVGRLIARPAELEVGLITALLGAPMLWWLIRRSSALTTAA